MENDLEEIVNDNIDEIGVDAVIERQQEGARKPPRWESWVALSSSLLAVLSAMTALYATFAAYHAILAKIDILMAFEKPVDPADHKAAEAHMILIEEYKKQDEASAELGEVEYKTHDQLAIAVALYQVAILLGGLAVVVQRPALWVFGMSFVVVGLWFMGNGLIEYFS
ncbi:MAG: DUF4337 family protein [Candidatus Thiodiazotropha sp.]